MPNVFEALHKAFYYEAGKLRFKAKTIFLGYHLCPEDARKAYLEAKKIYHRIQNKEGLPNECV